MIAQSIYCEIKKRDIAAAVKSRFSNRKPHIFGTLVFTSGESIRISYDLVFS